MRRPMVAAAAALVAAVSELTMAQGPPAAAAAQAAAGQTDRAVGVMASVRQALGGERRIGEVKTFVATGRTRQLRGDNLVPIEFEIQVELPDKYSRRDEFPAQDTGPATTGFNGDTFIQIPSPPSLPARADAPASPPGALESQQRARVAAAKQDLARLMLGMFGGAWPAFPVTFAYAGEAEAPEGKADVIEVRGPGMFSARLFVDGRTHLPLLLTWQAAATPPRRGGPPRAAGPAANDGAPAAPLSAVEQRMFFADYRPVDGLQLPFRIRRATAGDTTEETSFDRYRINAKVDPKRFTAQ